MSDRAILTIPAMLALALGSAASAQEEAPPLASVDATIAALEAGETDVALRYVTSIEMLAARDRLVTTPLAAAELLSGCKATQTRSVARGTMSFYYFEWACADETYTGSLVPDEDPRTVVIVDLMTKLDAEELAKAPRALTRPPLAPPAMPRAQTPEQIAAREEREKQAAERRQRHADAFGQIVMRNDVAAMRAVTRDTAPIKYSFHNPFLSKAFVEFDGQGSDALVEQVAHAFATLGTPTRFECSTTNPYNSLCKWEFAEPGQTLLAFIGIGSGEAFELTRVDFRYATRAKLMEAAERAQY